MKKTLLAIAAAASLAAAWACGGKPYGEAEPAGFAAMIGHDSVQILDVRTAEEYAEAHIRGALLLDIRDSAFVAKAAAALSPQHHVAVYCRSGRRSAMAAQLLAKKGYRVTNLTGGILAWREAGLPVAEGQQDALPQ